MRNPGSKDGSDVPAGGADPPLRDFTDSDLDGGVPEEHWLHVDSHRPHRSGFRPFEI